MYASRGRTIFVGTPGRSFEPLGSLPNPLSGVGRLRYTLLTASPWRSAIEWAVGSYQTTNVWPTTDDVLVATVRRQLFVSHDGGRTWQRTHQLPPSSGIAGVLPTAVCVHNGAIYLGEYPLADDATPRILRSVDEGRTWTTVLELPAVRHIHALCSDPYTGALWVTTGDRDTECQIGRLRDGTLEPVGEGDQRWRAVGLLFTSSSILWGMDCVYTDRNQIFRLDRADIEADPTAVVSVPNSVYFGTSVSIEGTQWVVFSTAVEAGGDSTAPDNKRTVSARNSGEHDTATVIAASARSDFTDWYEVASFRTRPRPVEHVDPGGWLPTANTYVFLGSDADHGVIVNPFNTATDHGRLITVSPETIARLDKSHTVRHK